MVSSRYNSRFVFPKDLFYSVILLFIRHFTKENLENLLKIRTKRFLLLTYFDIFKFLYAWYISHILIFIIETSRHCQHTEHKHDSLLFSAIFVLKAKNHNDFLFFFILDVTVRWFMVSK